MTNNARGLLTLKEAASWLGVSQSTVEREIRRGVKSEGQEGIFPLVRIGRAVRIRMDVLEAYVEAQTCHA